MSNTRIEQHADTKELLPANRTVVSSGSRDVQAPPELAGLRALWAELNDVPVDREDCLDQPFLHFEKGTFREDVWRWFEQHPSFVVGEEMSGLRREAGPGANQSEAWPTPRG